MLIIKSAKIYTMNDKVIPKGYIVVEDGKISEIGEGDKENIQESSKGKIEVIDASGKNVFPGFIDCHSHIGGMNFSQTTSIDDMNEMTNNVTPAVEAIYGVDPASQDFRYAYESGITSVGITPGSGNLICGLAFATKTYGKNIFDMTIKSPFALKVALGGNPKRTYGDRNQAPSTRMSMPNIIIDLFEEAREYMEDKEKAEKDGSENPKYNKDLEVIIPVLKKELPLKIHCTQFDMMTAIELANKYDVEFSIDHAWGACDYMDELVASGGSVIFGPIGSIKSFGEARIIDIESVVELDERGVLTAITVDAPILSIDSLLHHVGEAVRAGLKIDRALKMITINPAKILNIDDRVGSLEVGKDADIVIFEGLPTQDTNPKLVNTILNGQVIFSREDK